MDNNERRAIGIVALSSLLWLLMGLLCTFGAAAQAEDIVVNPTTLTVTEPNSSSSFNIRLTTQPTDTVTIGLSASDPTECSVPSSVALDNSNWSGGVNVTVTAVDDQVVDGDQSCIVQTAAATSGDANYNGINPADVTVTVQDNDTAGITVNPTTLTVSEPNGSANFSIKLTSQPVADVTVNLSKSNNECSISRAFVTLTSANWNSGVDVTVTAVDDQVVDGDQSCIVQTAAATSGDANYNGMNPVDVTVTVQDNDTVGITVTPTTRTVSEPNGSATFNIKLASQPTANVIIGLSTSNTQCTLSRSSVTLTSTTWSSGVTVKVTAVDDSVADGTQSCMVQTASASSSDPNYNGINPADVTVNVLDNDTAGITVNPTELTVSEPDGSTTFNIKPTSQPTANVTIGLSESNNQCSVSPSSAILTSANWNSGVDVTVSAVDDSLADGAQTCIVETASAISGDPSYNGINAANVTVTVLDDETANLIVSPTSLTVSEPNGSGTFNIRAGSEPLDTVTLALSTSNNECSAFPVTVILTSVNWSAGVTVAVTAVDDAKVDGNQTCIVQTGVTSSADPGYDGLNPSDVTVTVEDNDQAGITVEPISLTVSEPNGTAAFTVTLTSEPTDTVTVTLSISNAQCMIAENMVTLDGSNWSSGAQVIVTAVDDEVRDGDQLCVVQVGPASSADPHYQGLDGSDVSVTVQDDDLLWRVYMPIAARGWPPIPGSPVLQPISNADNDGTFVVAWSPAPRATSYRLERATDSSFSDATVAFEGSALSANVINLGPTRYFFRVQGRNASGDSPWSNPQSVDVLWEKELNNTIEQANGPILSNLTYYGAFPVSTDINDYFYIDLPAPGNVELWLHNIPADQNYDLVLRNSDGLVVLGGYSGNLGNVDERITLTGLPAGRYYIQVYHRSTGSSSQPYRLQVEY